MRTKQSIIVEQKETIDALRENVRDLKARHDFMATELSELASGVGVKPDWFTVSHSWEIAIKHKASLAIAKVAKMPLRDVF